MNTEKIQNAPQCAACGEGHLHPHTEPQDVEVAGHKGTVQMCFSVCDVCGAELASPAEALTNKRAMIAFEKQVACLLNGAEVRNMRKRYKLTQETAAELFGGGKVAFSRYENDDIVQSQAMDSLLRLCLAAPANLNRVAKIKSVTLSTETRTLLRNESMTALLKLAPMVQKLLDDEMALQRRHEVPTASNDGSVTERSVWREAA